MATSGNTKISYTNLLQYDLLIKEFIRSLLSMLEERLMPIEEFKQAIITYIDRSYIKNSVGLDSSVYLTVNNDKTNEYSHTTINANVVDLPFAEGQRGLAKVEDVYEVYKAIGFTKGTFEIDWEGYFEQGTDVKTAILESFEKSGKVFIAIKDITPFDEILEKYNAGKIILCFNNNNWHVATQASETLIKFNAITFANSSKNTSVNSTAEGNNVQVQEQYLTVNNLNEWSTSYQDAMTFTIPKDTLLLEYGNTSYNYSEIASAFDNGQTIIVKKGHDYDNSQRYIATYKGYNTNTGQNGIVFFHITSQLNYLKNNSEWLVRDKRVYFNEDGTWVEDTDNNAFVFSQLTRDAVRAFYNETSYSTVWNWLQGCNLVWLRNSSNNEVYIAFEPSSNGNDIVFHPLRHNMTYSEEWSNNVIIRKNYYLTETCIILSSNNSWRTTNYSLDGSSLTVENVLNSNNTGTALSANMGRELNNSITNLSNTVSTLLTNLNALQSAVTSLTSLVSDIETAITLAAPEPEYTFTAGYFSIQIDDTPITNWSDVKIYGWYSNTGELIYGTWPGSNLTVLTINNVNYYTIKLPENTTDLCLIVSSGTEQTVNIANLEWLAHPVIEITEKISGLWNYNVSYKI